ncbi:UDP-glycosyltransferase 73C6 [Forsythia ovata]|uniref:UDP-glycosyltransferase 73C6 n=1 Tax=Forsythia ovata TaxID=205694 RepID=A0ABD1R3U4_9LAMI
MMILLKIFPSDRFEKRVEERGIMIRDWAPQLEILEHPSTHSFISHCGWNSCIESITMGVPIAAWPMHLDQPRNSILITKVLKIGLEVQDWARRDEIVSAMAIEKACKKTDGDRRRRGDKAKSSSIRRCCQEVSNGRWSYSNGNGFLYCSYH